MLIRVKTILRLTSIISVAVIVYGFVRILVDGDPTTVRQIALLVTFPLWGYLFTLVIPTLKVILNDKGYVLTYGVGGGSVSLVKFESMLIPWGNVDLVYSVFPTWVPFKMIAVSGKKDGKAVLFFLGSVTTNWWKSLLFIAERVPQHALNEEVRKLLGQGRR